MDEWVSMWWESQKLLKTFKYNSVFYERPQTRESHFFLHQIFDLGKEVTDLAMKRS